MIEIKKLEDTPLAIPAAEFERILLPFIRRDAGSGDARWRKAVARRSRRLSQNLWRRRLLGFLPRFRRNESEIEREYAEVWDGVGFENYRVSPPPTDGAPWEWRGRHWIVSRFGSARLKLLLTMRAIELCQPASVLEIGSGNGVNLLYLAGRFPGIRFAGLELTAQGVAAARGFQAAHERFPAENAAFSPLPLIDDTAFRRVEFTQGSAQRLPFADGSFDMAMTVLALEQMESIRADALRETPRAARRNVLMIEPFADLNRTGLHRRYIASRDYLRAGLADLRGYGLEPLWATADFPQKAVMVATCVLAEKR